MSLTEDFKRYLSERDVSFCTFSQEDSQGIENDPQVNSTSESLARQAILKIDGQYAVRVLEEFEKVDVNKMRHLLNVKSIQTVHENDCEKLFPGCDQCLLPLCRNMYNLRVYCSGKILRRDSICLKIRKAGEMIKLSVRDFLRLAKPTVGSFTLPAINSGNSSFEKAVPIPSDEYACAVTL